MTSLSDRLFAAQVHGMLKELFLIHSWIKYKVTYCSTDSSCFNSWVCIASLRLLASALKGSSIYMFYLHSLNTIVIVLFLLGNPWRCFSGRFHDVILLTSSFLPSESY